MNTTTNETETDREINAYRTGIPTAKQIEFAGGCVECARYRLNYTSTNREGVAHSLAHRKAALAGLRAVAETKDWERFFRCVKKAQAITQHSSSVDGLWAAAMTLVFGPVGLHESWTDANGRPTAEARALPEVARRMKDAEEKIPGLLRSFEIWCVERFAEWVGLPVDAAS